MKIGITERGDAGIDLSWMSKIHTVDGMILITKNITENFKNNVLNLYNKGYKIIVHCTCTGYGNTALEPNVPDYKTQLNSLKKLIDNGFPAQNCVLRIDPIFPSLKGLETVHMVLRYFMSLNTGITRIRVSIVDEYKHVKERYKYFGWEPLYGDKFQASKGQIEMVANVLKEYPYTFETCAEELLCTYTSNCIIQGCISNQDLDLMNLPIEETATNPQNRKGCHCLSYKTELLERKNPCMHGCIYCFWKN